MEQCRCSGSGSGPQGARRARKRSGGETAPPKKGNQQHTTPSAPYKPLFTPYKPFFTPSSKSLCVVFMPFPPFLWRFGCSLLDRQVQDAARKLQQRCITSKLKKKPTLSSKISLGWMLRKFFGIFYLVNTHCNIYFLVHWYNMHILQPKWQWTKLWSAFSGITEVKQF